MSKDPCKPNTSPKPSSRLTCCLTIGSKGGEGNGTPLQYSCLEKPMDGGVW